VITTLNPMFHARNFIGNRLQRYLMGGSVINKKKFINLYDYANLSRAEKRMIKKLCKLHGLLPNYFNWSRK